MGLLRGLTGLYTLKNRNDLIYALSKRNTLNVLLLSIEIDTLPCFAFGAIRNLFYS
jgi:hypothetical protein